MAPRSPTVSKNTWVTGWPVDELSVPSRSCIENSRPSMRNHPRIAETPIAVIIPMLPDIAALRVSSVIYCARGCKRYRSKQEHLISHVRSRRILSLILSTSYYDNGEKEFIPVSVYCEQNRFVIVNHDFSEIEAGI